MLSLLLILLIPLFGAMMNGTLALRQSAGKGVANQRLVSVIACAAPLASFILSVCVFLQLTGQNAPERLGPFPLFTWMEVESLRVAFSLVADHLTVVMLLIITGVGSLIHLYSTGYMADDENYARYLAYLNLFLFFMLVLVLADSLPLLFVGWEGVGLCSYLLIGFWFTDADKAKAGKKAFITNRVGDFAFLLAMFFIVRELAPLQESAVTLLSFDFLQSHAQLLLPIILPVTALLFFGATGKSAQIPLYIWLPDAMAGPTPVSALIHAATMVTAGIYLIARLSFLFVLAPLVMNVIAGVGLATAFFAALIGVTQYDIKKVLAYSTVSQLGFMFLALGVGGFSAAVFHVMTHAFFKACLFLGAGSVIHALHHEQDIRQMGGLFKKMPVTATTFLLSTLAISGFPPFSGFFSKDEILFLTYANAPHPIFYWGALFAAGLTAFYMMRLFVLTFLGTTRNAHPEHIHESPFAMTLPLIVLAVFAVGGGWIGVPHLLGHSMGVENYWEHWLKFLGQKTPHELHGALQEGHLMVISTLWAVFCSLTAYKLYTRNPVFDARISGALGPVYRLIAAKFRIDELYRNTILRPIHWFSDVILFRNVDVRWIDGFVVNGAASGSRFFADVMVLLQTGIVSHYIFYLLLALIGMMVVFLGWI